MSLIAGESPCPTVRGELIRHAWETGITEYISNRKPIEKAVQWDNLLVEDVITVQCALSACSALKLDDNKLHKEAFLSKLVTVIPNSHSRNLLLKLFFDLISVPENKINTLVLLVQYYPLSVININMFLQPHFNEFFEKHPNKGEKDCDILVWCKPYLQHIFNKCDAYTTTVLLDWLSNFKYRAIHEFLLTTVSTLTPYVSKPEYWLFIHKLLSIVVPGKPPTLISSNRYASVLFSAAAALSPGAPLSPEHFLMLSTALYSNITLTRGLVGLAAYIITKHPSPAILPFIKNLINIKYGVHLNLFGCFLFPLTVMGNVNDGATQKEVYDIITRILNLRRCTVDERDYLAQDDYSEMCIGTQSTIISLKLGQILSHVAEKGTVIIEKQMQKSKLTTFSATVLCHCIVISTDRPSDLLMSSFRLATDATNFTLLTFAVINMKLIEEKKVPDNHKLYFLYIRNFHFLTRNASSGILKKMVKIFVKMIHENRDVRNLLYQVMWLVWEEHGGLVYNQLYALLNHSPEVGDTIIMSIIRKMCAGERQVDIDDMTTIIFRYLFNSENDDVLSKCLHSLTHLCQSGVVDVRQFKHTIDGFLGHPNLSSAVASFYCECVLTSTSPTIVENALAQLWEFTESNDIDTAGVAYKGLCDSNSPIIIDETVYSRISALLDHHEHPQNADTLISLIISQELQDNPTQTIGSVPNPSKKLVAMSKFKDHSAPKNLNNVLFSFSPVNNNASRQQYKRQVQQNERKLHDILQNYSEEDFTDPFNGIIMIEGWCHYMYEYMNAMLNVPVYNQHRRSTQTGLVEQLELIKQEVTQFASVVDKASQMFTQVLVITSITNAVYKIANRSKLPLQYIKRMCAEDIGLLRSLSTLKINKETNKTKAILFLCISYVAKITRDIQDKDLLKMLLDTCSSNITATPTGGLEELVVQCAGIATGVIIHMFYRANPKTPAISTAFQTLLDNGQYLGLCFCIDSFTNSIRKPATKKLIDEFINESAKGDQINPERVMFIGLLIVFSMYVDNIEENGISDFIIYVSHKIDTVSSPVKQRYYLLIQGMILYNLSYLYHTDDSWEKSINGIIKEFLSKFQDEHAAFPALALLTGFPISNLVDYFDWGPNIALVIKYTDLIARDNGYNEGKLCSLIVARHIEQRQTILSNYKVQPKSVWELIQNALLSSVRSQATRSKHRLRFLLNIISKVKCKLPLSNPIPLLVSIFTKYSLQKEVIRCAGVHTIVTSPLYFTFISKFLCLSIFPQLSLDTQSELILQIPNYIHLIRDEHNFFYEFLSETFWQGEEGLRLDILSVLEGLLIKETGELRAIIVDSLELYYFSRSDYHTLTVSIIDKFSELMKLVDYSRLPLVHLTAESRVVQNFIKSNYKIEMIVERYFESYLKEEVMYTDSLLREIVDIISHLDTNLSYTLLWNTMYKANEVMKNDPENPQPQIVFLNCIVLSYVAYLTEHKPPGDGLQHFLYIDSMIEPKVIVECLAVVLKHIRPWHKISKLYEDTCVIPTRN